MAICRHCEHECHHSNGGKCHCGCLNCEHHIKDALEKLEQKDKMDKEKIQSQEDQTELRAEVALQGQKRRKN